MGKGFIAVPSEIKAGLSAVTLMAALAYAYWEWTVGRPGFAWIALGLGIFAVTTMWVFPDATKRRPGGDEAQSQSMRSPQ